MVHNGMLTQEEISSITTDNMHERILELTDEQLQDPRIPQKLFSGFPGSQQNNTAMQYLQYRQMIENILALRSNSRLTKKIACFTIVTGISTVVIVIGTLVMAFK